MAYWLFKSEPSTWSWDDQVKRGAKGEHWDGVRNYQANNNMKAMKKGDLGFFYHSVDEKRIVGIVEVIREHYPDHTDESGRFGMVDIKAVEPVPNPVTLADVKADTALSEMALLKQSRLSVQPVTEAEWKHICKMAGVKKVPLSKNK
ncbi:EVE domain-containing protein [Tepidicaulis sp. LMO-SS28]|uniref:EVE domain-containing protein n=1 Tax=Tepidicaulis sp. LMO-SS28 TaxID=3447455 RepID=UPI003EDFCCC8